MMHLWQQRQAADEARRLKPKLTPAQIRVQKDLAELDLPATIATRFPDSADTMHFEAVLRPDEGMYRGGTFVFRVAVPPNYPHDPPKVQGVAKVYHPNLDLEGHVCLNILREEWNPILTLNSVLVGLLFLFLEPNPGDPLNKDVKKTMAGGSLHGVEYDCVL